MMKIDYALNLIIILDVIHLECLDIYVICTNSIANLRIKNVRILIVILIIKKQENVITRFYMKMNLVTSKIKLRNV